MPINSVGDLTWLVNHNCQVFDKQIHKLLRRNQMTALLAVAAIGCAAYLGSELQKQEERLYQLSIRVNQLEYGEGA